MKTTIFDIEGDSLNPTKIHVVSVYYQDKNGNWKIRSTTDYDEMRRYFLTPQRLVGHFVKLFDIPVIERLLGIKIPQESEVVDTCALSWALYPERNAHGLEEWGQEFGVPKKAIDDWENLPIEEYILRCEQDIRINLKLWEKEQEYMERIYEDTPVVIQKYTNYLMFKMDCLRDQQELKVDVDMNRVQENMNYFLPLKEEKELELKKYMPKIPNISKRAKPKVMYKKDGELSALGEKWLDLLEQGGFPQEYEGVVEVITGYEEPNPSSPAQVKDWLLSMGWEPEIYKESTLKDGTTSRNPQVRTDNKELCPSVLRLAKKQPAVEVLAGLTVINHRLGVLKSFMETADEHGKVIAGASGFTNTLRLKHVRPIANLPKVLKERSIRDGRYIRECMIAPPGYEFCGADMASLEDRSKQHYIYPYDPQYVQDMMTPDFDPHLDLAVAAGALTEEQATAHKEKKEDWNDVRHLYKTANYSAIYGVGKAKLAKALEITESKAKGILEAYWKRNWSVKKLAEDQFVKVVDGQMWQLNPLNGFYYSLRYEKDRFSTLNQGGATYIFDTWLYNLRKQGIIAVMQYHDEQLSLVEKKPGERERVTAVIEQAVKKVNKQLNLLREMGVEAKFGDNYADVH